MTFIVDTEKVKASDMASPSKFNENKEAVNLLNNLKGSIENKIRTAYSLGYKDGMANGIETTIERFHEKIFGEFMADRKTEPQKKDCNKCKWYEDDTGFCYSKADSDDHACHYEPKTESQKSCSTCGYSTLTPSCDTCEGYSNWWSIDDEPQTGIKGSKRLLKGSGESQTEPSGYNLSPVAKDINVRSKDETQTDCKSCKHHGAISVSCDRCDKSTHSNYEPQTERNMA